MNLSALPRITLPLLFVLVAGCSSQKTDDFVASGRAFLEKRDFPAAIIQFKNAVQKDAQGGEARYWLGYALFRAGDPAAAEIELRKAIAAGYSPDAAEPELLAVLMDMNQLSKAGEEAAKAKVTTASAKAFVLATQGTVALAGNRAEDARRLAAEALTADAASPAALVLKARLALADGKTDEAQKLLADALARSAEDYDALRISADLALSQGKSKEAFALYDRALATRPASVGTYLALVPALLRENDMAGAEARLAAMKKAMPGSPATRYLEALVAYTKGDRPRARETVRQVLKSGSDFVPALLLAGTVEYDLGNLVVAETHLQKVAATAPGDTRSRRLLISIHLRTGEVKKARTRLAELMKLDPDSVATNVLAGQVATASREPAKAAEYYQKAVAQDPKNALSRTMLGTNKMLRGDVQHGVADLEAASAADPQRIEADLALIQYFLQQKQFDKASQAIDALAKKQPENPQAANMRGGLLIAKGDKAGARKAFEEALKLDPAFLPAATNLASLDLQDRKPEDAFNRYRSILAKNPKQVQAALLLAVTLQRNGGKPAEVDKVITDAVAADPSNVTVRLAQIGHLQQTDRKKEALTAAQQASAAFPDDPRVLSALGRIQASNGEFGLAASTFGKLAALEPTKAEPLLRQSMAYAANKEFASARATLKKALDLDPDNVRLRGALVDLGLAEQRPDLATEDARTIQKKWPRNSAGYIAETLVLLNQKKVKEAEALLRASIGKVDDAGVAIQLFAILHKSGREAEADKLVTDWIASKPKDAALAAAAGQESLSREDYATAIRWYRAALKARPDNAALLNNLAWALGQTKDPQAMAVAEKARSIAPNNAAIIDTIGWLQLQKGDTAAAVDTLYRAVTLAPGAASVRINLAKALIAAGRKDEAKTQLQAVAGLSAGQTLKDEADKLLGSL
jgi:cellulose synthase operon protein C